MVHFPGPQSALSLADYRLCVVVYLLARKEYHLRAGVQVFDIRCTSPLSLGASRGTRYCENYLFRLLFKQRGGHLSSELLHYLGWIVYLHAQRSSTG